VYQGIITSFPTIASICVHPQDKGYQLIVWRRNPLEKMRYFHLNTVTYGTACAPYLATKCLQHLARRSPKDQHPELLKDDQALDLDFSKFSDATLKTLGIVWNPKEDKLQGRATPYEQGTVTF